MTTVISFYKLYFDTSMVQVQHLPVNTFLKSDFQTVGVAGERKMGEINQIRISY